MKYLDDYNYEGKAVSGSTVLPAGEVVRLPDMPCRYVQLSHLTVLDGRITTAGAEGASIPFSDSVLNAASSLPGAIIDQSEIFYAFGQTAEPFAQLFPGDRTELIPISDLNQVVARAHPGIAAVIHWTIFK